MSHLVTNIATLSFMNRVFNNNLANERNVATHLDQGKSVRKSMHCIIDICVECKLVFSIHFGKCFISLIRLNGFFHNQNNGTIRLDFLSFIGRQHIRM